MTKITVNMLRNLQACEEQVKLFEATFPNGAALTKRNLDKAYDAQLNISWLIRSSGPEIDAAYDEALKPLDAAYDEARKPIELAFIKRAAKQLRL